MTLPEIIAQLQHRWPGEIEPLPVFRGEHGARVAPGRVLEACQFLKASCAFDLLTDLSGVDQSPQAPRFEVHYLLYSLAHHLRLRLVSAVPGEDLTLDSVTSVWRTADWHEREAFDMFGVRFRGHPNLTRILMWDGYPYFPLRKDFPMAGLPAELPATAVNAGRAEAAPDEGGQFVAGIGAATALRREPRAHDTMDARDRRVATPEKREEI